MFDLSTLSAEVRLARGDYATVRATHEDAKKRLQIRCGELMAAPSKLLKHGQSDAAADVQQAAQELASMRVLIGVVEQELAELESLAKQRAELKGKAWPK